MNDEYAELSAYLDGELAAGERRRIETRLAADPEFARKLRQLERTSTMLAACMEHPSFHDTFFTRLRAAEAQPGRRGRRWAFFTVVAAAAAVAVVLAGYYGGDWSPETPIIVVTGHEREEPALAAEPFRETEPMQVAEITADTAGTPQSDASTETVLPIELVGTVTGEHATAILCIEDAVGGRSGTYAPGEEVLPGIVLLSVEKGQVILDDHGRQVTLTPPRVPSVDFADKLNGIWELTVTEGNGETSERLWVRIKRDGKTLLLDGTGRPTGISHAEFVLTGRDLTVYLPEMEDTVLSGSISRDGNAIELTQVLAEDAQNRPPKQVRLTRVPDESEDSVVARQEKLDQCNADLQLMYAVLRRYADLHDGRFPPSIDAMVIQDADTLALFEDGDDRDVTYIPGAELPSALRPAEPPIEPIDTYPDRLVAYENQLRAAGFAQVLWPDVVLRVAYGEMDIEGTADAMGRISVLDKTALAGTTPAAAERLAALRAQDQNNLKQLGLVIKMFQNEHHEYTPPGWLTVYPEYLTDTSILTSPKDPAGTDSYDYLLPATNVEAIVAATIDRNQDPARWAQALSELPLAINRTDWPDGGRNILYADGHVEYDRYWRDALAKGLL